MRNIVAVIVTLLKFCLNATYLSFRGEFYQQTYGTAMGSPVSVAVANLVMEDVEELLMIPSFCFGRDTLTTFVLSFPGTESSIYYFISIPQSLLFNSLWS